MRIYISGLNKSITEKEIHDRFSTYSQVQDVFIAKDKFDENDQNSCRGFAFITLNNIDEKLWKRLQSAYNNSIWKGSKIHLEICKNKDFPDRELLKLKKQELKEITEKIKGKGERKNKKRLYRHAKDMSLVTDKNAIKRKKWKTCRYGRAAAIMKLKKPNGQILLYDPSTYRNNLVKLFGSERPLPISRLSWKFSN